VTAPLRDRVRVHADLLTDRRVRDSLARRQHDPRPLHQPSLGRRGPDQPRQLLMITLTQLQRGSDSTSHHPGLEHNQEPMN
jgi:hypothetical protein